MVKSPKLQTELGQHLAEQMARDNIELPAILEKCCVAIGKYGLRSQGIYRISGLARKVASLKERLDKGPSASGNFLQSLSSDASSRRHGLRQLGFGRMDIRHNNVTSVLKMWFRELPDPVLTSHLHQGFVDAASKYFMLSQFSNLS